jgi:hypothetical protein
MENINKPKTRVEMPFNPGDRWPYDPQPDSTHGILYYDLYYDVNWNAYAASYEEAQTIKSELEGGGFEVIKISMTDLGRQFRDGAFSKEKEIKDNIKKHTA